MTARDTSDSLEVSRIVQLPVTAEPPPEVVEEFSRQWVDARYFEEGFRLNAAQVQALTEFLIYQRGLLGSIGVGGGKTLVSLMAAEIAHIMGWSARALLFVPSSVYSQLVTQDIAWVRRRMNLTVPIHHLAGKSPSARRRLAASGKRGLYIMTYSLLSAADAETLLAGDHENPPADQHAIDGIRPDMLIFDEAHKIKNPKAARTARILRYLREYHPRVLALSGTMTTKSIRDYHHQAAFALREYCPLPLDPSLAESWSYVLDPDGERDQGRSNVTGPLMPLVRWARSIFPSEEIPNGIPGFRKAYQLRLKSTPGVVSSGDEQLGISLVMTNRPVKDYQKHPDWPELKTYLKQVDELWRSPSGDDIEWGFHLWRYKYELTSGFYYRQCWPEPGDLARRGLTLDEASAYLEIAKQHHEERQEYHRMLRRWLQYSAVPGLDTPLLVGNSMAHHQDRDVPADLYAQWRKAKDLEFKGMPERLSVPVRICDYKIQAMLEWAEETMKRAGRSKARSTAYKGGLVWFHHDEVGRWAAEALQNAGIPSLWCPAASVKSGTNEAIIDPANHNKIVVASMGGHGTGKNLQHFFQEQLFLDVPRKADLIQQVLGRTHRRGQAADELAPVMMNTLDFDHQNMWACLIDSLYIHQTNQPQKLIQSSWDPLPKQYPSDFLRERGFVDIAKLDEKSIAELEEKFGPAVRTARKIPQL